MLSPPVLRSFGDRFCSRSGGEFLDTVCSQKCVVPSGFLRNRAKKLVPTDRFQNTPFHALPAQACEVWGIDFVVVLGVNVWTQFATKNAWLHREFCEIVQKNSTDRSILEHPSFSCSPPRACEVLGIDFSVVLGACFWTLVAQAT